MATILDLGKLRFHFAGDWNVATTYEVNDIVKYGGNVYVYSNVVRTAANLPTDPAYWVLMVEGFKFRETWDNTISYRVGDGVAHGGVVYIAVADSQGQTPPNAAYWSQFADGIQWEGTYAPSTTYQANDVVKYGAQVYIATQDSTGNLPTNTSYWETFVTGISSEGVYNASTAYVPGDLVAYGANIYRCTAESTGTLPTNVGYFELFSTGNDFKGVWNTATAYLIGETVRFGGNTYEAVSDNQAFSPDTNPGVWKEFTTGVNARGEWVTSTFYAINDVVNYGGNTFIVAVSHTSGTFNTDLAAIPSKWTKFNSGVRYVGAWAAGTTYIKDDIVSESVSTYIATEDHIAGADFFIDNGNGKWNSFVVGASYVLPAATGQAGKYLQTPDGVNYSWQFSGANDKIFYVSEDSTSSADDVNHGTAIDYAFASLKYTCEYINADIANRTPATIFIKDGTYNEQLPIHIPVNVTIVGDGQRNCIIQPDTVNDNGYGIGISDDGVTPNSQSTMLYVNSGTMIEGVLLRGMTGFEDTVPSDITQSTVRGVFLRIEPGATLLKSPYIKESSAFSSGGVGAIVDGSVVAAGTAGSMVFHTFTQVHDGGVGFWIKDNGLSEIVSCFTYYNDYGYAATGGGKIRALNGNNSYGEYGAVSQGFDTSEYPLSGYVYGDTVEYVAATLNTTDGFTVGDIITGADADSESVLVTGISIDQQALITTESVATVTAITAANPASVTATAHGFSTNDIITLAAVVGMTEVNTIAYTITVVDANTFTLGVDSTAYTAYTSGGTATKGGAHGLSEGQDLAFGTVVETEWQALLGSHQTASMYNRTWYADVVSTTSFRLCSNSDMTNYLDTRAVAGWGFVTVTVSDATRSNPVILTMPSHGYANGQLIQNVNGVSGMTQLNGNDYYAGNITGNTVELYTDSGLTTTVDGTGFTAYTSGGTATRILNGTVLTNAKIITTKYTAKVANIQTNLNPGTKHRLLINDIQHGYAGKTIKVAVYNNGHGNRYTFDGQESQAIKMDTKHRMYIFEQNDVSNVGHPMYFSTTADGEHAGGTEHNVAKDAAAGLGNGSSVEYWLDGLKVTDRAAYIAGFDVATAREVRVVGSVADLYAVCSVHPKMAGGRRYTPQSAPGGASYDHTTGVMVLDISTHTLTLGSYVKLDNESLTFTCAYDGNTVQIAYPKASSAGVFETYLPVLAVTSTTITINVGKATGDAAGSNHTFVSATSECIKPIGVYPTIKYTTTTQHSSADEFREQGHGPKVYPFANNSVITAQDGQFATLTNTADPANQGQFGFAMVLGGLSHVPVAGGSLEFVTAPTLNPVDNADIAQEVNTGADTLTYIITSVSEYIKEANDTQGGTVTVTLATEKQNTNNTFNGQRFNVRYRYSQVRLTGHDFLSIGTGNKASSNYPGVPTQNAAQGREVTESYPGRVYYVSTDQDGNFRVGSYFRVDQATGRATLDASAFDLAGLTSLRLGSIGAQLGENINEFSSDGALTGNSNLAVPTEQAVKTYVDTKTGVAIAAISVAALAKAFDISNVTRNAIGQLTSAVNQGVTYSSITYTGSNITQYTETSANGTAQTVTMTYDANNIVQSVVIS
jgi:hypothetical protein